MKVGVICPKATDATSWYRCMGPLGEMRRDIPGFDFFQIGEFDWSTLAHMDVLFVQRPETSEHLLAIKQARRYGVPVWVDYDDDLTARPDWNPGHRLNLNLFQDILEGADLLTVSTEALYQKYKWYCPNRHVVKNALNFRVLGKPEPHGRERPYKIVLWRGSSTHQGDYATVQDQLIAASYAWDDVRFVFMGGEKPPDFVLRMNPMYTKWFERCDLLVYNNYIKEIAPDVMIVPLKDVFFNRAKSNIAYLEGGMFGATAVAPAFPEWEGQIGCRTYQNEENFSETLRSAIDKPVKPKKICDYIASEYDLREMNKIRYALLEEVCCRRTF